MIYFSLFIIEIVFLWLLSRSINTRFYRLLPTLLYVVLFLPGTFLHEFSHFLAAKLLFVPVGKFSLKPKVGDGEVVLGSVAIAKTNAIKRLLVGAAPIVFGITLILLMVYLVLARQVADNPMVVIAMSYFVFVIANTMFSSRRDLEGAWKVILPVIAFAAAMYFLGVRTSFELKTEVFRDASLYLFIPIAIDAFALVVLSLINRLRLA